MNILLPFSQVLLKNAIGRFQNIHSNWDCIKSQHGAFWERIWICIHWTIAHVGNLLIFPWNKLKTIMMMRFTFFCVVQFIIKTVNSGFYFGGVIGPYFLRNEAYNTATVRRERYRSIKKLWYWIVSKKFSFNSIRLFHVGEDKFQNLCKHKTQLT